jgi:hypothetical protein
MELQALLNKWATDQNNYELNLKLAEEYTRLNQPAAAITHYIKTIELINTSDIDEYLVKYHCLCMISWSYLRIGHRWRGAKQYAWFAQALMPDRPEAYYLIARCAAEKLLNDHQLEQCEWSEVYTASRCCLYFYQSNKVNYSVYFDDIEYASVLYAISMLRLNMHNELKKYISTHEFTKTDNAYIMNSVQYIYNELRMWCPYFGYNKDNDYDALKVKFPGADRILFNNSESMQDMFALTVNNGKSNGTYLEIGAGDWKYGNNTLLLEQFGWKGISIEYNQWLANEFNLNRKNKCLVADALKIDYSDLLNKVFGKLDDLVIDYASIDIDPANNTLSALMKLPLDKVKFRCITFEHDSYQSGQSVRLKSRDYLYSKGYKLIGEDIKFNLQCSYEDWWVHPDLLTEEWLHILESIFNNTNGNINNIFY